MNGLKRLTNKEKEYVRRRLPEINPDAMYFADYFLDQEGNKIEGSVVVQAKDLTEGQILNCELIKQCLVADKN